MNRKMTIRIVLAVAVAAVAIYYRAGLSNWFLGPPNAASSAAQQAAADAATAGERKVLYWVDPMHPSYKSDQPGIAPDCGMKLVPVYADQAQAQADLPPGAVPISAERQQLIGVKLGQAELRPVRRTLRAVARITYDESRIVHYHNKVEGWIEKAYVNYVGQPIRHGEPLFTIYSPELVSTQQEYLIALKAKRELGQSSVPEIARSTEALFRAARQRLQLWDVSEEQIRRLEETGEPQRTITFYATHHGIVLERKAVDHMRVTADTDLYTIVNLSRVWAIAEFYEYEAPLIRLGLAARLTLAAFPGEVFRGRVSFIYPQVDPQTRTLKVRVELANPGLRLRPDMFGDMEIEADLGRQLVVPVDAVLDSGTEQYVFVSRGEGYFEPRRITVGLRADGYTVVTSGLKAGETVATSANFLIDSESRLKSAASQMSAPHQH